MKLGFSFLTALLLTQLAAFTQNKPETTNSKQTFTLHTRPCFATPLSSDTNILPPPPVELDFLRAACELVDIPGEQHFECLRQVSSKNPFTFGLSMEFADAVAYQRYRTIPTMSALCRSAGCEKSPSSWRLITSLMKWQPYRDTGHPIPSSIAMKHILTFLTILLLAPLMRNSPQGPLF